MGDKLLQNDYGGHKRSSMYRDFQDYEYCVVDPRRSVKYYTKAYDPNRLEKSLDYIYFRWNLAAP